VKKQQINIDCERCRFAGCSGEDPHVFYVRVDIEDEQSHQGTSALLECKVEPNAHYIRPLEIGGEAGAIDPDRLEQALETVAARRLCGNNRICPAEIVDIVKDIQDDPGPE